MVHHQARHGANHLVRPHPILSPLPAPGIFSADEAAKFKPEGHRKPHYIHGGKADLPHPEDAPRRRPAQQEEPATARPLKRSEQLVMQA